MANDRISIVCKGCGCRLTLFKYYPTVERGYCPLTESDQEPTLSEFFRKHIGECRPKARQMDLGSDTGFELHTEETEP